MEFKDRRRHQRITTNIPIEFKIKGIRQRGVLLNLSEGGALIGYIDLPIDEKSRTVKQIYISMELPLLGDIELEGEIIRFGRIDEMNVIGIIIRDPGGFKGGKEGDDSLDPAPVFASNPRKKPPKYDKSRKKDYLEGRAKRFLFGPQQPFDFS